jgi:ubiquitin-protein ligase
VKREWDVLKSSLPDGIHVIAFEDRSRLWWSAALNCRLDLLCAVIFCPRGSLYEAGVFAFDIALKEDHPACTSALLRLLSLQHPLASSTLPVPKEG